MPHPSLQTAEGFYRTTSWSTVYRGIRVEILLSGDVGAQRWTYQLRLEKLQLPEATPPPFDTRRHRLHSAWSGDTLILSCSYEWNETPALSEIVADVKASVDSLLENVPELKQLGWFSLKPMTQAEYAREVEEVRLACQADV